ncbi:mariner transposase [Trichonephila clavipes]|nr:mariner transposase [Trichonephila clavipes]
MMDRISICEAEAKRNEINPFLKRTLTRGLKNGSHTTILCEKSWSRRSEAAKTVAKPGLASGRFYCVFGGTGKESFIMSCFQGQTLNSDIYCQQLNCLKLVTDQKRPEQPSEEVLCSIRTTPRHTRL